MLYFPTAWNSLGTVIWHQISGFLGRFESVNKWGVKYSHSVFSLINPWGVLPHLCGKILTSYVSNCIRALIKSLDRAPYPL